MSFPTLPELKEEEHNETLNKEKRSGQTLIRAIQKIKQDAMITSGQRRGDGHSRGVKE